ncbi:MAG TPA: penicillin-binding protein activator [Sphingomicrobium sp.]|nr:penicillin-binding protein activator [Sphingomicrobium sp.]
MTLPTRSPQARRLFLLSALSAVALTGCATASRILRPSSGGVPTKQQNEVALLAPLTGEDAILGQSLANAARLALADMNNSSLQLTIYNTAEGGAAAATDRALGNGARLILGPLLSDQVRAVAPIARAARVPVLAFSNDETAAGGGTYILGFVPSQAVDRVVSHARAAGAVSFAALSPENIYGRRASQGLLFAVQRAGGQVIGVESYSDLPSARSAARRLNSRRVLAAVLLADGGRTAGTLAQQFRPGIRILGTDVWAGDRMLGRTARLRGAWYAAPTDIRFGQFAGRYKARYGATPPRLASIGYDAMLLTIRASREWRPGRRFPVNALGDDEGFLGVDGVFRFNRQGVAERGLEVRQVTASGYSVVSPAPTSF